MKLQLIFNTQSECDAYFGGEPIPSKYLVIIKNVDLPDGGVVTNSALTTTNNIDGSVEEVGESALSYSYSSTYAYVLLDKDYDNLLLSYTELWNSYVTATGISYETLTGQDEPKSTIEIYSMN